MTLALPWCYLGIILAFHGVTLALPWHYPGVTLVLPWHDTGITLVLRTHWHSCALLCTQRHGLPATTKEKMRHGLSATTEKMMHVLSATLGTNEAWAISHNCKKLGMGYQPQLGTMRHGLRISHNGKK